jgi:hypothetical protein
VPLGRPSFRLLGILDLSWAPFGFYRASLPLVWVDAILSLLVSSVPVVPWLLPVPVGSCTLLVGSGTRSVGVAGCTSLRESYIPRLGGRSTTTGDVLLKNRRGPPRLILVPPSE